MSLDETRGTTTQQRCLLMTYIHEHMKPGILEAHPESDRKRRAGIVSFSARIIAAWRALESEQGEAALFSDPLAKVLAGDRALRRAKARVEVSETQRHQQNAPCIVGVQLEDKSGVCILHVPPRGSC